MSGTISSLFSSAEVKSIVGQLETRLQAPITIEQDQVKSDTAQISALGTVQGALSSLNGALSGIANPSGVNSVAATVSNSNVTATAAASATTGTYNLTGIKLAQAQEVYSATFASGAAKVGSGSGGLTFAFASGGSASISITTGQDTVNGIATAINAANKGITASVVQTASGDRLVLSATKQGSGQAFSVTGSGGLTSLSYSTSGGASTLSLGQAARNASFSLNGVPVTESSNANLAVVNGVTLALAASGSSSVTVAASSNSLSAALSTFADKLNSAVTTIATQTAYQPAKSASASASGSQAAKAGPLLGNVAVEQIGQSLLSAVSDAAGSGLSANAIGLTVNGSGGITFDASKFSAAFLLNPTGVDQLVSQIQASVHNVVSGAIGSAGATPASGSATGTTAATTGTATGFLQASITNLQSTNTEINQQITLQQKLDVEQVSSLEAEFTTAETNTSGASTTLDFLNSLFTSSSSTSAGI
jgi:flagellar hook-associated protein 2